MVKRGDLDLFEVSSEADPDPEPLVVGSEDDDAVDDDAVIQPEAEQPEADARVIAVRPASHVADIKCKPELKALLEELDYEKYTQVLCGAGITSMGELLASSQSDLKKIGLLPGHAGYLLQQARKHEVPDRAAKQLRVEAAGNSKSGARTPGRPGAPGARGPAPAPSSKASPQAGFCVGTSVMYKQSHGDAVRAKVTKMHGNGRYDVQYQTEEGQSVVRLSVPRDRLAFI